MQACKWLSSPPLLASHHLCCREVDCPKNHIIHFESTVAGSSTSVHQASFCLVHHKNERRDGKLVLPVASDLVGPLALLEKAAKELAPDCPTLFSLTR